MELSRSCPQTTLEFHPAQQIANFGTRLYRARNRDGLTRAYHDVYAVHCRAFGSEYLTRESLAVITRHSRRHQPFAGDYAQASGFGTMGHCINLKLITRD